MWQGYFLFVCFSVLKVFLMWAIFKVVIVFVTILFWFFGREACEILAPQLGVKPTPPALEGKASTTRQPGKSLCGNVLQATYIKMHVLIKTIPNCESREGHIHPLISETEHLRRQRGELALQ